MVISPPRCDRPDPPQGLSDYEIDDDLGDSREQFDDCIDENPLAPIP